MFPLQYRPSTGVWVSNIFLGPDEIILWQLLLYALSHTTFFASSNLASQRSQEICGTCQRLTSSRSALSGSSGPKSGNLSGCEVSSLLIGGVAVSTVIDRDGVNSQFFSELMTLGFLADIRSSKKIRQIPWIVSTTQFWSGWFMNVSHVIIRGFLGLTWTGFTLQVRAGMCYTPGHAMCDSKQAPFSNIQPARPATSQPSQTTAWVCQDGFKHWNHNIHSYGIDDTHEFFLCSPWHMSS